jgi:hypothetical protein
MGRSITETSGSHSHTTERDVGSNTPSYSQFQVYGDSSNYFLNKNSSDCNTLSDQFCVSFNTEDITACSETKELSVFLTLKTLQRVLRRRNCLYFTNLLTFLTKRN